MWIVLWTIISIFVVLGIDYAVKELIKAKLSNTRSIILCDYSCENEIEHTLRCIMFLNPDSEIYVIKQTSKTSPVLEKMVQDYKKIHIKNLDTILNI